VTSLTVILRCPFCLLERVDFVDIFLKWVKHAIYAHTRYFRLYPINNERDSLIIAEHNGQEDAKKGKVAVIIC